MLRRAIVVIAIVVVSLAVSQLAFAAVATHVTATYSHRTERFHGTVKSPNSECRAHRTVKLWKKTSRGPSLQGQVRSTPRGQWHIEVMHAHGHYYAAVPKTRVMHMTCPRGRSHIVDVM